MLATIGFFALAGLALVGAVVFVLVAVVAGIFKLALKALFLPLLAVGFLLKAVVGLVVGVLLLALALPFVVGGAAVLALPLLLVLGMVWAARRIVATA